MECEAGDSDKIRVECDDVQRYFHTRMSMPAKMNAPPIRILGVKGSFRRMKDNTSVITILAQ
jgi:hypothetical protein